MAQIFVPLFFFESQEILWWKFLTEIHHVLEAALRKHICSMQVGVFCFLVFRDEWRFLIFGEWEFSKDWLFLTDAKIKGVLLFQRVFFQLGTLEAGPKIGWWSWCEKLSNGENHPLIQLYPRFSPSMNDYPWMITDFKRTHHCFFLGSVPSTSISRRTLVSGCTPPRDNSWTMIFHWFIRNIEIYNIDR